MSRIGTALSQKFAGIGHFWRISTYIYIEVKERVSSGYLFRIYGKM